MVIKGRELTCLIVEQDPEPPARPWLLQRGIPTSNAQTQEEALLLLRQKQFSMLLLDYAMLAGLPMTDFLAMARESVPKLQVILTTNDKNAYEIAAKAGVSSVILKPYDEEFLLSYVSRLFRSKQASGIHFSVS